MNALTYVLDSTTKAAGTNGIDVFESGTTTLTISFSGVNGATAGAYHYLKFLVEYSDLEEIYVLQNTTNLLSGAHLNLSRTFHPSDSFHTTYTIDVSGVRTDLLVDLYRVNFTVSKPPLNFYKDHKIVSSYLHTNIYGQNTLLITTEAENPNYVGNFYIPYDKSDLAYEVVLPPPFYADDDTVLRSEPYTYNTQGTVQGGGYIPIITEKYTNAGVGNDNIIAEHQYVIWAIGAEEEESQQSPQDYDTGMLSLSGNTWPSSITEVDINNRVQEPTLILVPEDGIDYSEYLTQDPSFISHVQSNIPNRFIKYIFADGNIEDPRSAIFKEIV